MSLLMIFAVFDVLLHVAVNVCINCSFLHLFLVYFEPRSTDSYVLVLASSVVWLFYSDYNQPIDRKLFDSNISAFAAYVTC